MYFQTYCLLPFVIIKNITLDVTIDFNMDKMSTVQHKSNKNEILKITYTVIFSNVGYNVLDPTKYKQIQVKT